MNIDEIIQTHEALEKQLKIAASTMERKDTIQNIRAKIVENQNKCPHFDLKYNWTIANERCPYCGKKLG